MNIINDLNFSFDNPVTLSIRKTEKINVVAVGLVKNQALKKHTTSIPTLLTVLKGEIQFKIEGEIITLNQFSIYQIPVNVEHEVLGNMDENIFTLTQEK